MFVSKLAIWSLLAGVGAGVSSSAELTLPAGEPPPIHIKLYPFAVPPLASAGMLVKGQVNGGPILRLLLDSGAQLVVLSRSAAAKSSCLGGTDFPLIAAGAANPKLVKSLRAKLLTIDSFAAHDVPVLVAADRLPDGVDGVAPLALFSDYSIRIDFRHKRLDLISSFLDPVDEHDIPAVVNNNLLFVKGKLNNHVEGYFLFDTGASYNAVSRSISRELNDPGLMGAPIALRGGFSDFIGSPVTTVTQMHFGPVKLAANQLVAVDLDQASRRTDLEIAGLLGFPLIREWVTVVSYREGRIRIEANN